MTQRCVKCSETHDQGKCENTSRATPAYCVNCGDMGHPANFRKCPRYLDAVDLQEKRKAKNTAMAEERVAARRGPAAKAVTPALSFAEAARSPQPAQQQQPSPRQMPQQQQQPSVSAPPNFFTECLNGEWFGIPLGQIFLLMRSNVVALKACTSQNERSALMVDILMNHTMSDV